MASVGPPVMKPISVVSGDVWHNEGEAGPGWVTLQLRTDQISVSHRGLHTDCQLPGQPGAGGWLWGGGWFGGRQGRGGEGCSLSNWAAGLLNYCPYLTDPLYHCIISVIIRLTKWLITSNYLSIPFLWIVIYKWFKSAADRAHRSQ